MLSFENETGRTGNTGHYLPKVKIKDCNAKIYGRYFFEQPLKSGIKTYENIQSIPTGQEVSTRLIIQALNADPKAIQKINLTGNLERAGDKQFSLFLKKSKKLYLFSEETVKALQTGSINLIWY